jgi:hypothetical protein
MALATAKLFIKVTASKGTNNYTLLYDDGTNPWSNTLDSADWDTTETFTGGTTSIGSTGWKSFTLDVDDISAMTLYVKLYGAGEGGETKQDITFASQNNATAGDRPYIELVWASGATLRLLASTGVGV